MTEVLNVKVNCTLVQALSFCTGPTVHRGSKGVALLFLNHTLEWHEGSASRPGRSLPPGKTRYPSCRSWLGPRAVLDRCGKFRHPPGIDPRTVQPVASRYTD